MVPELGRIPELRVHVRHSQKGSMDQPEKDRVMRYGVIDFRLKQFDLYSLATEPAKAR